MGKLELGLIFGGKSLEHPISILSAKSIIGAIDQEKYNVIPIFISPQGQWFGPKTAKKILEGIKKPKTENDIIFLANLEGKPNLCYTNGEKLPRKLDVVFPALHGPFGEDGTIQGLFEMIELPYIGSGVLASALAMDKGYMKEVFARHNLPQTGYYIVEKRKWLENKEMVLEEASGRIGFPAFVKPAALGSSMGVEKVNNIEKLKDAIKNSFTMCLRVIIEKMVSGRELECSVLGNKKPSVAGPGEVVSRRDFYDYQAKYTEGQAELIFNPDIPQKDREKCRELALLAFKALGCRGMARVDFFYPSPGRVLINEINTIPGFTQFSMYPKLWVEEGLRYDKLIDKLVNLALENE